MSVCMTKSNKFEHLEITEIFLSFDKIGKFGTLKGKFVANKFKLMSSEGQTSYFPKLSPQFTKEAMACTYF